MAEAPSAPSFFGPLLIASDFSATVRFYREALGLAVEGETPYAECSAGGATFAIVDARFWGKVNGSEMTSLPGVSVPPTTVLAVRVPDVDAVFERLMALQFRFISPPTDRPPMGLRNAFLRDPDGRTVEITSSLPPPGA